MPRFSDNLHDIANEASPVMNVPVFREDLTDSNTVDCTLAKNKDNIACTVVDELMGPFLISFIIVGIIIYGIIIFAAMKTKNQNFKIFLIVSMFLPFLTPITLILALLIITNAI